jgi:hypothetical protein
MTSLSTVPLSLLLISKREEGGRQGRMRHGPGKEKERSGANLSMFTVTIFFLNGNPKNLF